MAVATFTRRQVVDMLPEFLTRRGAAFVPPAEALAAEIGVPRLALVHLANGWILRDGDSVRRERFRLRSPYAPALPTALDENWALLVGAGLAEATGGGWRVTARGAGAATQYHRSLRATLRELPLPAEAARRAAGGLGHLASRIPTSALRASWAKQRPHPDPSEPRSDAVTLDLAVFELWYFRDDCHIGAWRAAGYDGPAFEVLSYVWASPPDVSWTKIGGHGTLAELAKAIEARQDRAEVERNVAALVARGGLARDGQKVQLTPQGKRDRDAVEDDTDRLYFEIWDLDDAATEQLGEDLRAVIDAIPT